MPRALVTGSAGFIGYHLCERLLATGWQVAGFDGMTDYYAVTLKQDRHAQLRRHPGFTATEAMLADRAALTRAAEGADVIVHLAAQAGVRYSFDNPGAYVEANLDGTYALLEAARAARPGHLLIASTSSVYGAGTDLPYAETAETARPLSFYAATKKANEAMSHAWAHLHGLPTTCFRFFTVYGPWGRPDMALFKFTRAILAGEPIEVFGHGQMWRDFTYIDDLIRGIELLIPEVPGMRAEPVEGDTLSPDAPWRVVNIGNSQSERLSDFIDAIEAALGKAAVRTLVDGPPGDVPRTWADCTLLRRLTGYRPDTPLADGVAEFVAWYRDYYRA